ncbi:MAG: adenylate/guanylate cyclase domain-containing protein [Candidatus Binatia bacterium]
MRCAGCGCENPGGMKFCEECGNKLARVCASCSHELRPTAKFCGNCGAAFIQGETAKRGNGEKARDSERNAAERRQLTVMFCDLVGSTALSEQLDPEELREVIQAYQETCDKVIQRYEGYIAQYLGDGLLVYFGYPVAHEDEAARAVRAGLEIVEGLPDLNDRVSAIVEAQRHYAPTDPTRILPLQVRIGIHTGQVVVGEIGSGVKRELLALGEAPNLAARIQGQSAPDTAVISATTSRLVEGLFEFQDLGPHTLKGISTPLGLYRVKRESTAQNRFAVAVRTGLTPLIGREQELALLQERWNRAQHGEGQLVLLSGEPGIGKSRLAEALKEHAKQDGATHIEFRCSPYHQNSAFYPVIEHLQQLLQFGRDDSPQEKLHKLEVGARRAVPLQADIVPLLAALLSLPHPDGYPPLTMSPQKQKQKTQEALVAWLREEAEQKAVYCVWEDLHWADPSTLEVLSLLLDQVPTTRLLTLLTFRPEFIPPWRLRSHITQLTLNRLGSQDVEEMVTEITGDTGLPLEVRQQIVSKTDGVPLFVEELTKSVIESGGARHASPLQPLGIPATLQDSLMARLDRLGSAKEIAQLGATLGREFSYELLQAVSSSEETNVQHGLARLVDTELLYQRGIPPQATYTFKHALIQDTAYQSLLKSTRQQYHRQIAQILEERFVETKESQPELLAHHYTEAGLTEQAIPYWQQAGQKAVQRSANMEAIAHLTKGLELLKILPETPERNQQELTLQLTLGTPLMTTKGYAAPETEQAYTRAGELCQQLGENPQLFSVLFGLAAFRLTRGEIQTARELSEQLLGLALHGRDPALLVAAQNALGETLYHLGEFVLSREHLEHGIALYDSQEHYAFTSVYGADQREQCLCYGAFALWQLGYPDQALKRIYEALTLAQAISHPFTLAYVSFCAAFLHHFRGERPLAQEWAEAVITLSTEQGFPWFLALGTIVRGWTLAEQGQEEDGIAQIQQGLDVCRTTGAELVRPYFLALLAEGYGKAGLGDEGLTALAEALSLVDRTEERVWEAEVYRLKGELTLLSSIQRPASSVKKVEECFLKAINIARKQQAKSLELRAVMSLVRLRQQQALADKSRSTHHGSRIRLDEARTMLSDVYHWFTEGFDTKDLQEAKALLEELRH